jgi:carboxyl-terminal processing protease
MPRTQKSTLLAVMVFVLFGGVLATLLGQRLSPVTVGGTGQISTSIRSFTDVYDLVEQNYAEPVDANKAIYNGAIPGMLHVLDPHSNFFDPKSYAVLKEDESGKYYGVGMTIGPRNNQIIVIAPFVGTPAYRAGIHPGDVIIAIDGKPTDNMSTTDVAEMVKGVKGSTVHITLLRQGSEKPLEFALTRDEIPRHSVDLHFLLQPGVGYMHISMFNETASNEVRQALKDFGNLNGLVLDLRQDPGGLLNAVVEVADNFLPKGSVIVSQRGRASPEKIYRAAHGDTGRNYPLVVLVDRGTASAAEILAGAIQDHDRGLVAGESTFGKGLVQTIFPLSEDTALALTTAKYYTPSGRLIQRSYSGVSLYDYFFARDEHNNAAPDSNHPREVKSTDSGRPVYGGDGITPDVKIANPKDNRFRDSLALHYVFFNFAQDYLQHHQMARGFTVDEQVMQDFRSFLKKNNVDYTEQDLAANSDWVKSNIKTEIFTDAFGLEQGLQAQAQADPEVVKAIQLIPQARELAERAHQIIAQRSGAPGYARQ